MTQDLYRSTDSLLLPTQRRFIPFKIPQLHHQLRHYLSTTEPDRIYVITHGNILTIHLPSQTWDVVSKLPFDPRCMAVGLGWIAVGGADHGQCALVKVPDYSIPSHLRNLGSSLTADVDSALPIDLDPSETRPASTTSSSQILRSNIQISSELGTDIHTNKFGGSIVNSVTLHRFPAEENVADEDVMIISNNDMTVKIYSITRSKVLETLGFGTRMNYAIISPDSKILAVVGDENVAYFYSITRDSAKGCEVRGNGDRLIGFKFTLLHCYELEISTPFDDGSCFSIAFSPSSRLCAVASQAGIITIFDVDMIREVSASGDEKDPMLCSFKSSRPDSPAGAVRCMAFSPDPWDLLVWVEDTGRAGVADIRQAFTRRQILKLDKNDPSVETISIERLRLGEAEPDSTLRSTSESTGTDLLSPSAEVPSIARHIARNTDSRGAHDSLTQDFTARERQIIEFLNTARWASRHEPGADDSSVGPLLHSRLGALSRGTAPTDGTNLPPSLAFSRSGGSLHEYIRENYLSRVAAEQRNSNSRFQSSLILPPGTLAGADDEPEPATQLDPNFLATWTDSSSSSQEVGGPVRPPPGRAANREPETFTNLNAPSETSLLDLEVMARLRRVERSNAVSRRHPPERVANTTENRYEAQRATSNEMRANLAAERLRRQRLAADEGRSPRWARTLYGESSDSDFITTGSRVQDAEATAGVGWGADQKTLYIGTTTGIFEYQLNLQDRKTFPILCHR